MGGGQSRGDRKSTVSKGLVVTPTRMGACLWDLEAWVPSASTAGHTCTH